MLPRYDDWKLHDGIGIENHMGSCGQCGTELFEGDSTFSYDGDYFCEVDCLAENIGAKEEIL